MIPALGQDAVLDELLSPESIRERCLKLAERAERGEGYFRVHPEELEVVADRVVASTRRRYPDLKIPPHARWGHFLVGGINRLSDVDKAFAAQSKEDLARARLDLVVVSVLLDAGSGGQWKYDDRRDGRTYARSEGLAVASLDLFLSGAFSSDPKRPYQVDAAGLRALTRERLANGFQVGPKNPLAGLDGRLELLQNLGKAIEGDTLRFGSSGRPSGILDYLKADMGGSEWLPARAILDAVLRGFGSIWPGRLDWKGAPLGDVWEHPALGNVSQPEGWVCFHKLSQWMTYSLLDPAERFGFTVTDLGQLTGLAEYRNGGLIVDAGLITLEDPGLAALEHMPGSELIVEWRALTVTWLDRIALAVRKKLGVSSAQFPLACVLEGGTWWAGREIASELRPGGNPPLKLASDGTVF